MTIYEVLRFTTPDLKPAVEAKLKEHGYVVSSAPMWVYSAGEIPVLLVAHMDTVCETPRHINNVRCVLTGCKGLGADDRAGVWGILEILRRGFKPHVLFTDGEERGCVGANAAVNQLMAPGVRLMIELDRRGDNDCVFYSCTNAKVKQYAESFGFKEAKGSFTDISTLMPGWGIGGVNLSIGYYNEHSGAEKLVLAECLRTVNRVAKMMQNPPGEFLSYRGEHNVTFICDGCDKELPIESAGEFFGTFTVCAQCMDILEGGGKTEKNLTKPKTAGKIASEENNGYQTGHDQVATGDAGDGVPRLPYRQECGDYFG